MIRYPKKQSIDLVQGHIYEAADKDQIHYLVICKTSLETITSWCAQNRVIYLAVVPYSGTSSTN